MKFSRNSSLIPIFFLLAIFLFPTIVTNTRPIALKSSVDGKFKLEEKIVNKSDLFTDAIIEEELNKEEFIKEVCANFDLRDFLIYQSKLFAVKTHTNFSYVLLKVEYAYSGKFILKNINNWLI